MRHALISATPLGLFWAVAAAMVAIARLGDRLAFEADEATGASINFMVCLAVVLVSWAIVSGALAAIYIVSNRSAAQRNPGAPAPQEGS